VSIPEKTLKPCPPIALIGFSGAGKSTVARLLAPALGRPCIDTDDSIEVTSGMSVPDFFQTSGEAAFRAAEHEALCAALDAQPPAVIACGGGVVELPENAALLRERAVVIYLRVETQFALARIGELHTRPLLSAAGTSEVISALMTSRMALYEALADISVNTNYRDPQEVCDTLIKRLKEAGYEL